MQAGETIGRFEVTRTLGQGGIATVYEVRHRQLETTHALKMLTVNQRGLSRRLLQEGRIQAQLRHPNVVAVTDVVEHGDAIGLLMEFVEGASLEDCMSGGRMAVDDALNIFRQVLAGVGAAHAAGITHRDLKPANILLTTQGDQVVAKVLDFGIAKVLSGSEVAGATRAGVTMGTPGYMAPEQITDSASADHRSDIFALGAILYEMISGERAFHAEDMLTTLNATAEGNYPELEALVPGVPRHIVRAIDRALVTDRDKRTPDCSTLARQLFGDDSFVAKGTPTRPPPPDGDEPELVPDLADRLDARQTPPTLAPAAFGMDTLAPGAGGADTFDPAFGQATAEQADLADIAGIAAAVTALDGDAAPQDEVDDDDETISDPPSLFRWGAEGLSLAPADEREAVHAAAAQEAQKADDAEDAEDAVSIASFLTQVSEAAEEPDEKEDQDRVVEGVGLEDGGREMGDLAWTLLSATAWALGKCVRYGGIPTVTLMLGISILGQRASVELGDLGQQREMTAKTLKVTMDDAADMVPVLTAAGAESALLNATRTRYEQADTLEAKVAAARELSGVMSQQLAALPPPRTQQERELRRRIEMSITSIQREAERYERIEASYAKAASSIGGKAATLAGGG